MRGNPRPKNTRVRLVGGGFAWSRAENGAGASSAKSMRRAIRSRLKKLGKKAAPEQRKAMKEQISALMAVRNKRKAKA